MGCCIVEPILQIKNHSRIRSQIEDSDFSIHSSCPSVSSINDPVTIKNHITMSPLIISLWNGNFKDFSQLLQKGASTNTMEALLEKQGKSGLEILIDRKNSEMFKFYLPLYLLNTQNSEILQKPLLSKLILTKQIDVLRFLYTYFYFVKAPPAFNFHYIDSKTGENCAFAACWCLDLEIIKFINEECEVDFSLINNKRQTTLQIAVLAMEKQQFFFEIFKYLIQNCKVDICRNWEKIMLALDNQAAEFYKLELEKFGVSVTMAETNLTNIEKVANDDLEVDMTAISSISGADFEDFSISILN